MPLEDFLSEAMTLLQAARFLRYAEASGEYGNMLTMIASIKDRRS